MSSPEDFPANLFPTQVNGGGEKMSVIYGRRCSVLYPRSDRLGLSVKMLLESPLWSKDGYYLIWDAIPLCSRRVTTFTDTNSNKPSPSNGSAEILRALDIPSNRCLFRLRVLMPHTEETGCSSLPLMQTPTAVMTKERPEDMRARARARGYKNGTRYGSLESQINYDPRFKYLLPTPNAMDMLNENTIGDHDVKRGHLRCVARDMWEKGLLPTPNSRDWKGKTNCNVVKASGNIYGETLPDTIGRLTEDSFLNTDGKGFRLSPLFTEEMMGFPFLWTTLPFLRQDGDKSPSKPTETQ